ncbi:MAG: adenylosuccinate synthetase [Candidatus Aenigmarchaeota archaeon]|nr:adenylosuccinate synthetase [Candidatus Aenigmarchaeota archaeon]
MVNTLIVGAQWGDEGKGKFVDALADGHRVVARYNGGDNAGHTVVYGGKRYAVHAIPSGIFHKDIMNVMGRGMVVSPRRLVAEMKQLQQAGIEVSKDNLMIDYGIHLILPYHVALDSAGSGNIGTTGKGIGPAYADKANRIGVRLADLKKPRELKERVERNVKLHNNTIDSNTPVFDEDRHVDSHDILKELEEEGAALLEYAGDVGEFLDGKDSILVEGAQGVLLDIDNGTYPFVTSSSIVGVDGGLGCHIPIERRIGVVKLTQSRVGNGPFPTELGTQDDLKPERKVDGKEREELLRALREGINDGTATPYETGRYLRVKGGEYGTTTGRPRRMGWPDIPLIRYARRVAGLTELAVTKLDILTGLKTVELCTDYKKPVFVPTDLGNAEPEYASRPGWEGGITEAVDWEDLPETACNFLRTIEYLAGLEIGLLSTGPDRNQLIDTEA